MANENLLIIDEDVNTLKLLKTIFDKEGYTVHPVKAGREAVAHLKSHFPQLILLDLVMPDMNGFEFLEKLKKSPRHRLIPVVILTSRRELEDKFKALRLGAIDYLTKPFQREELITRVRNILDHLQPQPAASETSKVPRVHRIKGNSFYPNQHLGQSLFRQLRYKNISILLPSVRKEAPLGYDYPAAAAILNPKTPGAEITVLEEMAEAGHLERSLYDVIHLCPHCNFHDVNFREVCPYCESINIKLGVLIEHSACKGKIWEHELDGAPPGICPKCNQPFNDGNGSYTRSYTWLCQQCQKPFTETIINCRCLNCNAIFDVSDTHKQKIYAYKVATLTQGKVEKINPGPEQVRTAPDLELLGKALREAKIAFLEDGLFEKQVDLEIQRSQRRKTNTTVMSLEFKNLEAIQRELGPSAALKLMRQVIITVNKCLRHLDKVGLKKAKQLLVLLPEMHLSMAKILGDRIRTCLDYLHYDLRLEIKLASYPQDGQNAREILEILELGLEKIKDEVFE